MSPPRKQSCNKPKNTGFRGKGKNFKLDVSRKNLKTDKKKERFIQLVREQRELEQTKREKRLMIERKRQAREEKRSERNKAWRKLTKKGQPIMKERINYLLKELQHMSQ